MLWRTGPLIVVRYALRRMRGQLVWLTRPSRRPTREGLLHLPGTAASLRVTTAPDGKYGAVHNPHTGTLTAVVKVSSRAYALLDPGTQQANVGGWGRALAALARTGQIARIQVIERTTLPTPATRCAATGKSTAAPTPRWPERSTTS